MVFEKLAYFHLILISFFNPDHLFAPSLTTDQPMPLDQNSTVPQQNYTAVASAPVNDPVVPVGAPPTKPNNGTCLLQSTVDLEPNNQSNDASINPIFDKPTTSSGNKVLGLTYLNGIACHFLFLLKQCFLLHM